MFVHGGVSGLKKDLPDLTYAQAGRNGDALDAVEDAVKSLEDDPVLNAGYGAVLNRNGELELDAGIADGKTGHFGAVANVRVRHPVTLARRVLDTTPHVLITGGGAAVLGNDLEALADTTAEQRKRWSVAQSGGELDASRYGDPDEVDTVGAVGLDEHGHLAAASSTGGVFGKLPGRVGDAAVFGAGVYASQAAAVVGTGVGERFLETLACLRAGLMIEQGTRPQEACEKVIALLAARSPQPAGILAIDRGGIVGAAFRGGAWAVGGPDGMLDPARID